MSLIRMANLAAASGARTKDVRATIASETPGQGDQAKLNSAMEKITTFIPSEVVGLYVASLGIIAPVTPEAKWWIFGICVVLVPIFLLFTYLIQKRKNQAPGVRVLVILILFGLFAFVAWASALPSTPFLQFTDKATEIGGAFVIGAALFLYRFAEALGIVPGNPTGS